MACAAAQGRLLDKSLTVKLLKYLVSAGLFGLAAYLLDWDGLVDAASKLRPVTLIAATVIIMVEFPIYAFRWHLLVRDVTPLDFQANTRRYFLAVFFNTFTPAQIGGDVYRFFSLKRHAGSGISLLARLIQERLLGLIGILCFYLLCLAWAMFFGRLDTAAAIGFIYVGGVALVGLSGLLMAPWFLRLIGKTDFVRDWPLAVQCVGLGAEALSFGGVGRFLVLLGCSFISAFGWTVAILLIAWDLGSNISFSALGLVSTSVEVIRLIPVTVQGIGVREPTFAFFFEVLGFSPEKGFVVGTIAYLALSVATLLAGVIGRFIPDTAPVEAAAAPPR